ncbi:MAG: hypothetical protein H0X37_12400 [Herpetosiphonaceae bacterium]|nr:hypothetical protein [Herpetosiphonaceae bacterium]
MLHHLIMFDGSPGAGKSTLSSFLAQQLTASGITTQWFYEEAAPTAFAKFWQDLRDGRPQMIDTFLGATTTFVATCSRTNATYITDSLLPGYHFFVGGFLRPHIEAFGVDLFRIIEPLHPLVIYLSCDVEAALDRAVAQRGTVWLERLISRINAFYYMPLYTHSPFPFRDKRDLIAYEDYVNQFTLDLLGSWSKNTLILDTTLMPVEQLKIKLLDHFELIERATDPRLAPELLDGYAGTYEPLYEAPTARPLTISIAGNRLFADTYWPNGTPLVAESDTKFRLQSTSNWIEFTIQPNGAPSRLTYFFRGELYGYEKVA